MCGLRNLVSHTTNLDHGVAFSVLGRRAKGAPGGNLTVIR